VRKIYIASSWKNKEYVSLLAKALRDHGHEVFDFTDGDRRPEGLDKFTFSASVAAAVYGKRREDIEYKDFMTWEPTKRAFKSDKAGLDWADTVVLLLPCGRSAHLEAGYAAEKGKDLIVYGDLPLGEFEAMYGFAKAVFRASEFKDLIKELEASK